MLTSGQIRAARALLAAANVEAVRRALEAAGVIFLDADHANEVGAGVRLRLGSEK